MMKIFNVSQIKACDQYTIEEEGISSLDLMGKAANSCFIWLQENFSKNQEFYIFCGTGNNGGDGLALSRILFDNGYKSQTYLYTTTKKITEESKIHYDKLVEKHKFFISSLEEGELPIIENSDAVIIDALLGIGLNRPLGKKLKALIFYLNSLSNRKISIDIPSGLYADTIPQKMEFFRADDTLSFQFFKRTFLHKEGAQFVGKVHILDIGLSKEFIEKEETNLEIITTNHIQSKIKHRGPFSHKGDFGKVVIVGGSYGKIGAVVLSANAALKTGCGLVFSLAPSCGYIILQTLAPEAMFMDGGDRHLKIIDISDLGHVSVGIGPGMGTDKESQAALKKFLKGCDIPIVLDADALNIISENKELLKALPENSIITPHKKEFERLFGENSNSLEMCESAKNYAQKYKIVIVLKGHITNIITPEGKCWYNVTGNAGMAKGGSGDVLTGIITGLLAQGYTPEESATIGVFIHGFAGDLAAKEFSQQGMISGDIIKFIPQTFLMLENKANMIKMI